MKLSAIVKSVFGLIAATALVAPASAIPVPATWSDSDLLNQYVGHGGSFNYIHSLGGYSPGLSTVSSWDLTLNLRDDANGFNIEPEIAVVNLFGGGAGPEGLGGDIFGNFNINIGSAGNGALTLILSNTGQMFVNVSSLADGKRSTDSRPGLLVNPQDPA